MGTVFPDTIEIGYQEYIFDASTDAHGNRTGHLADPVTRYAVAVYWAYTPDPMSIEFVERTISQITLLVYDPQNYKKLDRVLVFNGAEQLAYEVMDVPVPWDVGYPWQRYNKLFVGEVHGKRVT